MTYVDGDESSVGVKVAPWIPDDVDVVDVDLTRVCRQVHASEAVSDSVVDLHSHDVSWVSSSDLEK